MRVTLHPDGLAPRIANLAEWASHLIERLDRQVEVSQDPGLVELAAELRTFPGVVTPDPGPGVSGRLFVPLVLRHDGSELRLFSTVATFGTALDVTIAEPAIESFFPADAATAGRLMQAGPS